MQTINETILTTVVNTMVERTTALEAELAACKAELVESRREFDVVDNRLCQFESADSDAAFWQLEHASSELLLTAAKAELAESRREFDVVEGALDFWQLESERKQDLLNASAIVIREYNQYFDDLNTKNEGVRI